MTISKGQVAFITGAASGIGMALARDLVQQGGKVIVADLNHDAGEKLARELNASQNDSVVAIAVKVNTTVWEEQVAAVEKAKATFGRIDYVFANAGIAEAPWLPTWDPATAATRPITKPNCLTLDIDLTGQLYTAALALQTFERQEIKDGFRGKLIMTASVFGFWSCPSMPMYSASKAGVVNYMRSAAAFYEDKNVTVNLIAPNLAETNIAPGSMFAPFHERGLLTPVSLVIEQINTLLGKATTNGAAIGVCGKEAWIHPIDEHKRAENIPGMNLIDEEISKLMGYPRRPNMG